MAVSLIEQACNLPIDERRRLAEEIFASIDAETPAATLAAAEEKLLDERSADYRRNPDAVRSWTDVRRRILGAG